LHHLLLLLPPPPLLLLLLLLLLLVLLLLLLLVLLLPLRAALLCLPLPPSRTSEEVYSRNSTVFAAVPLHARSTGAVHHTSHLAADHSPDVARHTSHTRHFAAEGR
jgi:hypothetical protein